MTPVGSDLQNIPVHPGRRFFNSTSTVDADSVSAVSGLDIVLLEVDVSRSVFGRVRYRRKRRFLADL